MNAHVKFIAYNRRVFRNIATVVPSQNLVDDLVDQKAEQAILEELYYDPWKYLKRDDQRRFSTGDCASKSEIGDGDNVLRSLSPIERSLQRSYNSVVQSEIDSKFLPENWYASRYSDGTWPVLYAAESEKTALYEAVFHLREFYKEELQAGEISVDRRVCSMQAKSSRCVDVLKTPKPNKKRLTSRDRSGYPYCQKLAARFLKAGTEVLRAPSARDKSGTCVAVFDEKAIAVDEGHMKYVKLVLTWGHCRVLAEERVIGN